METFDYELACRELAAQNDYLVVLDELGAYGRPLFITVFIVTYIEAKINGRFFYGVAGLDMNKQKVRWFPYNDIAGYKNHNGIQLDGIDRMLTTRFAIMDRTEALDVRASVQLMVEDLV